MLNTPSLNDILSATASTTSTLSGLWTPAAVICGVFLAIIIIEAVVDMLAKKRDNSGVADVDA